MSFLIRSGNVTSGDIGNAAVLSGSIGSGQIGSGHFASGLIAGLQSGGAGLVSGQVTSGFIGDNAVVSGSIASGQISDLHFASGANINEANWLAFSGLIAGELISGGKAVTIQSGTGLVFRTGFNPLSGILVYGLVPDIALSGQPVKVYTQGPVFMGAVSGLISGKVGAPFAYTGNGIVGVGGPTVIGTILSGSIVNLTIPFILSGTITGPLIASGAIQQGQLATTPGPVIPGTIASGVIVETALEVQLGGASGVFNNAGPFLQTAEAISGVRAVSFQTNQPVVHEATIQIAKAGTPSTMPAFGVVIQNVTSGAQVNAFTHGWLPAPMLSGTISGHHGEPVFVGQSGDISLSQPTNSGALVQVLGTAVFDQLFARVGIELGTWPWSGSISASQLGSGVIQASIASGQINTNQLASGAQINFANAIMAPFVAEDMISGVRAVTININPSGNAVVRIAQPLSTGISNGAHWPAQGLVIDDVVSGGTVNVYFQGLVYSPRYSGNWSNNFTFNNPAWVNASGGPDTLDTINVGSGFHMPIGYWINASGLYLNPFGLVASGSVNKGAFQSDSIQDYAIGSGQIGANGVPKLASESIFSGNFRSGLITTGAQQIIDQQVTFAGETISGGGTGVLLAVTVQNNLSGRATVLVANPADSTRRPAFGVVTKNYASGDQVEVITNGILSWGFSINTNLGQPFFVGNSGVIEGINLPTFSGAWVQPMGVALGRGLGGNSSGTLLIQPMLFISGFIHNDLLGSGAVLSGNIGSGQIAGFGKSGLANARMIASGSIGGFDMADVSVASGQLEVNQIFHRHLFGGNAAPGSDAGFAYGAAIGPTFIVVGQGQMSGGAVAFSTNSSGALTVVPAERQSGLRLPCIGVMASGQVSGGNAVVVTQGFVAGNHFVASGFTGQPLYVGSGGFITTQSGFTGTFSGAALISGSVAQRIGVCVSGGMLVHIDMAITSGFLSTAQGNF